MLPRSLSSLGGVLLTTAIATGVYGAPPRVDRVEPPHWWAGHSWNPVHLLITGENLQSAHLETPPGFQAGAVRNSENGNYLLVELRVPPDAEPGPVALRVAGKDGQAPIRFDLLPWPPAERRPRGLTTDDVIYLIMPDRFANGDASNDDPALSPGLYDRHRPYRYHGGDFQGVIDRLDYLRELGVTALWLTPWYDNVNHLNDLQTYPPYSASAEPMADYHGYNVVDFYATEEHFGSLALLTKLVERAHESGLKVIQDQVVNFTSPYHPWVTNPPTPTWYNGTVAHHLTNTFQTWTVVVSNPPPEQLQSTLEGWFFGVLPDLNQNDPDLADYLIQNSLWWVGRTGVDAMREDALPYVPRPFWAQLSRALKHEYPRLTVLGEMWDGDPHRVAFFQGGRTCFDGVDSGVDVLFDFPLYYALRDVFARGRPMSRLTDTLAADSLYVNPAGLITFIGLHDQPRFLSEPGATLDGLKLAFAFLFTTRGTPLIYYGDEIAMYGLADPDNRKDFPGGWKDDPANAFNPSGRTPDQASIHDYVRKLLRLRHDSAPLRNGKVVDLLVNRETYVFARVTPQSWTIVALNNSTQRQAVQVPVSGLPTAAKVVTDRLGRLGSVHIVNGTLNLMLPPRAAAVLAP